MKKLLLSGLIILLIVLICFAVFKGVKFAKVKSIQDIKTASNELDEDISTAEKLAQKDYGEAKQTLDDAIKSLKQKKEEYERKNPYNAEQLSIGELEIKTYKIHYLWTILGNYRKDEGVRSLNLDLKSTNTKDVYDLQFTLVGNYLSITDFLYDIEDDEELNFQVKDLKITKTEKAIATTEQKAETSEFVNAANSTTGSNQTNTTTTSNKTNTTTKDPSEGGTILKATFTVKNIGITLD